MNNIKDDDQPIPICTDDDQSWYRVSELKIKLPQVNRDAGIFANGRNRVAIDIYIHAANCKGNTILVPSDLLLQHVWLVDYDTQEPLAWNAQEKDDFTWAYIDKPNEFTRTPRVSSLNNNEKNNEDDNDTKLSRITYYVYCSPKAASKIKQLAVLVRTPAGITYTTAFGAGSDFDAFVQLLAIHETRYKVSDIDMVAKEGKEHLDKSPPYAHWYQYNTYVKLKRDDRYIVSLSWSGDNPLTGNNIPFNCMHQRYHETGYNQDWDFGYYYVHFIWSLGEETYVSIGNTTWWDLPVDFNVDIEIRQEGSEVVCFTIMCALIQIDSMLHDTWLGDFTIYIYDQYGNLGKFLAQPRNDNDGEKGKVHLIDIPI
ncbi:hypothetical protein [Xenorhabdus griffiniae]|uniref:Uncharacterized protein n=1 Tax=Xenorhabdus griffiniae TaxID=351672 RepID=A0ABY9XDZ8_9GAMM|nr:hypothetical protein [Xenorhabdus griffiniae]MBD1226190.1 hypothetical protein [Xenorhabdus griffiniae]MBE8585933.1 hypothetical protein [Xenorhabdus griffiniae]WMV71130.1 hypothetical protein QL128_13110 [Xenorhabdus griffiniae]WNH00806.1 hypothetical protein QL112_013115 [Xenorhabdus griffiniae]